jgi:hypothetical protein
MRSVAEGVWTSAIRDVCNRHFKRSLDEQELCVVLSGNVCPITEPLLSAKALPGSTHAQRLSRFCSAELGHKEKYAHGIPAQICRLRFSRDQLISR